MKNRATNDTINDDYYPSRPNRPTRASAYEIQLNIESPKSVKSNPDMKLCVFERDKAGYGFKITGNAPVKVQAVRQDGVAWLSGLRENDVIIEVNGTSVINKMHKDVVSLIRKETRLELLVDSDNSRAMSPATSSSPKWTPRSPLMTRIPKFDSNIVRPNSLPKAKPRAKAQTETVLRNPTDYHSVAPQKNNINNSNCKTEPNHVKTDHAEKSDTTDTSSDYSISTSSAESNSPKKKPVTALPVMISSPTTSRNGVQTKPDLKIVPTSSTSGVKVEPRRTKMSPDKLKNKTIPPDGAKSYNPIVTAAGINSKLDQQSAYGTLPKKKKSDFILGRDFDEDSKDDDGSDSSLSVIEMLSSPKEALSKPGLVAIILSYVKERFDDLKIMIFYYNCKLYKSLILRREFQTDSPRMANEIITTFLHEKSPLCICTNTEAVTDTLRNFKVGENLSTVFDEMLEITYGALKIIVEDVRGKVKRGIQLSEDVSTFVTSINSTDMNNDREMNTLHRAMCNIINKSQKDSNLTDTVLATQIGLATMYQYFHKSNFLPGASIKARSTDCLNNIMYQTKLQTISEFFKISTLCSPYQQKLSLGLRKKSKSINGHVLVDVACQEPEECAICEGLLWGASPQGILCTMCKNYYHVTCKKKIKATCSRKLRKSNSQINNKEDKPPFFGRLSRKSSTNSVRSVNMSVSGDSVNNIGNNFFGNSALVADDKTNSVMIEENMEIPKSLSEDQLNRVVSNSMHFERMSSNYDLNGSFMNQSLDNGGFFTDQGVVQVQELVQDESLNDSDMKIEESFDAETEIKSVFPHLEQEIDKKRLIVLLEFYHKTRYILMNLKRFWYTLVQKWPQSQYIHFKALSLDCIDPFVTLIKSLVLTIEKCITEHDFVGLEQAVLDWLSDSNDDRLKEWVTLSSNLCCTNSLNAVKHLKQTTLRTITELTNILKAKFHKLVMIEELTQIRPLLISLPLIVKNIIKCLSKQESLYSEELAIWKQVSAKMDYLCEYIDRCCIPLVDWINNGSICKRSERFDLQNKSKDAEKELKEFCLDFPRTLFHFPIFDFQIARIITWSTNTKKLGMVLQAAYFKKGTEVLLIFYKTFIVVLQKENDHYVLKPIKPLKNLFERQAPIIEIDEGTIVKNGGLEENLFVLNVISHKPDNALLLRIGFSRFEVVESWLDYINTKSYSLARSISLFKSNDLSSMPESLSHFERTPSNVSWKSKASQESIDPALITNSNPDLDDKDQEKPEDSYICLSEALAKASKALACKQSLCAIMNIQEDDLSSHMQVRLYCSF